MTQMLVVGVLITGLVGLLWVITLSIFSADHPSPKEENLELAQKAGGRSV